MRREKLKQGALIVALGALVGCASGAGPQVAADEASVEASREEGQVYEVRSEEVSFEAAGTQVHGTLVLPVVERPVAALVLVAGSGPTDRNWESPLLPGENGSARLLAEALAERGVASLRYDKRATGQTALPGALSWSDYQEELAGAAAVLAGREEVDAGRVFIAGHSEGGAHALRAVEEGRVAPAGLILLSSSGRSLGELIQWQLEAQLLDAGVEASRVRAQLGRLDQALRTIAAGQRVRAAQVSPYPGVVQLVQALQAEEGRAFSAEILLWEPTAALAGLDASMPVLVLSGERDLQVDPQLDARALAEAARGAGLDVTLSLIPLADHVLKAQETPREELTAQHALLYNEASRRLDPQVVDALLDWIEAR
ncbi:alpha/beta hydrolase [Lujinxingia litoralis]|uniref:Alpha/beta hydrolase n=1 Tax=Lujinxingia litoralis TaxID=2211119 RepID=A0A328C5Z0_9DELT|nr:alpha/beta fold hydrolase [Lujinxingia litoralis]RAL22416.1 alpha/beta hydrolase [Lujinxingia litoralis]